MHHKTEKIKKEKHKKTKAARHGAGANEENEQVFGDSQNVQNPFAVLARMPEFSKKNLRFETVRRPTSTRMRLTGVGLEAVNLT